MNLRSPRVLYVPPFRPGAPAIAIQVPKRGHGGRAARRSTDDKLLLGLLSKISAGERERSWKRGEEEGLGSQTKPAEHLQIKRGAFLPVQAVQKKRRSAPERSPGLGLLGPSAIRSFAI